MPPTTPLGYLATLLGLSAGLVALWIVGERYAPADAYYGWPIAGVSPVFVAGAVGLAVLVLDRVGGGVISIAVRVVVARIRMLGLLVFGGLLVWYGYRRFVLAP